MTKATDTPEESREQGSLEQKIKHLSLWLGGAAIICGVAAVSFYGSIFRGSISGDHERWGQFGDFFGGTLNPIFGLLSLVAILITLFFQAKELSNSTKALEKQADHLELQAFESTFFSMASMHNENLKSLDLEETEDIAYKGRAVFKIVYRRLSDSYKSRKGEDENKRITEAYESFYNKNQRFIGHYISTLLQIFDFIRDRCTNEEDDYWKFISAQLTSYELLILFYHCIAKINEDYFLMLVKNGVFDELTKDLLLDKDRDKDKYKDGHEKFLEREVHNG